MIFGEAAYFMFLPIAAAIFHLLPRAAKPWWLFVCGTALYGYYSPSFLWLLLAETVVVFLLARASERYDGYGAAAFAFAFAITLGVLGLFKYAALLDGTMRALVPAAGELPSFPRLYLPLAISFFTFEFIHYIVERRRGTLPAHGLGDFLAFVMFFPTMVAGPIKRFGHFKPQLDASRLTAEDVSVGVGRLVVGVAKKSLLADTAALLTTPLLTSAALRSATRAEIVGALVAYSAKIYFDFSGYSDMAIGSARLFGVRVPENFAWPYLSTSIAAFWRRWHMSLSAWITDYVYIPLGGSRKGLPRTLLNLVVAMVVSGLWHGAAWHFAVWGLYHGSLLAGHRVWRAFVDKWWPVTRAFEEPALEPVSVATAGIVATPPGYAWRVLTGAWRLLGWGLTFSAVTLGWGLFAMPLSRFFEMLGRLTR